MGRYPDAAARNKTTVWRACKEKRGVKAIISGQAKRREDGDGGDREAEIHFKEPLKRPSCPQARPGNGIRREEVAQATGGFLRALQTLERSVERVRG